MDTNKVKKVLSYGGLLVAFLAFIAFSIGLLPQAVAFGIMGICGFGAGTTALRARIDSLGIKSYIVSGVGVILSGLLLFNVVDINTFTAIAAAVGTILGITLDQALTKTRG